MIALYSSWQAFLPACSPDYNPIELMWSKENALLHKSQAHTNDSLLLAIADALAHVTQEDASNWLAYW
jgi:transposase